ncbi:MAG: 4-demethylwyosine synthase TYW1 [Candidatus Thermoplasmatota archaeon]|nr:4-demethylwyosine synthase TYW1 [Candidatus Thermoplasmatota archaeon]
MQGAPITKIEPQIAARLAKQRYHLVGEHGGVKVCHWTKQSLIADRSCYKGTFYGIESHGGMQLAPIVDTCNLASKYCWREPHSDTLTKIDDDPYELFLESVRAHRRLLTGYGGNPKADREKWLDAQNPKHVAISLNGEPTLYSRLGEFLEICHQHGVSTFLVTNGSLPKVIEQLDPLPTQLYVSVDAPNKEIFNRLCKPKFDTAAFEKLEETLELLPSLDTRTVCRHTLIKGESLGHYEDYARLDNIADPDFIEAKGYVYVGNSRSNHTIENMPSHDEIMEFSRTLAPMLGREVLSDRRESRVALIGKEMIPVVLPERVRELPADLGIAKPQNFKLPVA